MAYILTKLCHWIYVFHHCFTVSKVHIAGLRRTSAYFTVLYNFAVNDSIKVIFKMLPNVYNLSIVNK